MQAKLTSKRKRLSKALPVLGAAGLSLSLTSAASAVPSGLGDMPTSKTGDDNRVTVGEEDISLAPYELCLRQCKAPECSRTRDAWREALSVREAFEMREACIGLFSTGLGA